MLSIPAAYFGGYLQLPVHILKMIIGVVLLFSAARLFFRRGDPPVIARIEDGRVLLDPRTMSDAEAEAAGAAVHEHVA